jgi:hypothetical protein
VLAPVNRNGQFGPKSVSDYAVYKKARKNSSGFFLRLGKNS